MSESAGDHSGSPFSSVKLILRPLSAKLLPPTIVEQNGKVDRDKLLNISGRSRKIQVQVAIDFGLKEYPTPAGGCLLTDKHFSNRLKDLMDNQEIIEKNELYLLRYGRHFRLDPKTKVIVGRTKKDNENLKQYFNADKDILLKHDSLPGPDVILTGDTSRQNVKKAALILSGYIKSEPGENTEIKVLKQQNKTVIDVKTIKHLEFQHLMIGL